jgi:predicted MFS family arabinose efflux permease
MSWMKRPALSPAPPVGARLLYLGPFVSSFDRFSIAPLLLPIARDLRVSLAMVAAVATVYYLLYGLTQPIYGLLSDRFGRVTVIRWSLAAVVLGSIASAAAPNLEWLLAARLFTGATVGAVIPASLVYIGDSFPFRLRQGAVTDISAATAAGTALGILGAGVLATFVSWRAPFLITGVLAGALVLIYRALPEPARPAGRRGPAAQLRLALTTGWAVFLFLLAFGEGVIFPGLTTFFAPALQARGVSAATAGLVVAGYGLATLVGSRVVKRLTLRVSAVFLIVAGGVMLVPGYLLAAAAPGVAGILAASLLAGAAFAFLHSTLQTWATEVVPEARGTATALFATMLFLGAAAGTALAAGPAEKHSYPEIFLAGAALTVVVATLAAISRGRYRDVSAIPRSA